MSWLAPLYLAGFAALAIPLYLHLIRRTPSGRTPFGSLLFLRPTPPRFVQRRRLDQILLLCLRALALALLALAFSRPFLRDAAASESAADSASVVAVLLDTSASMRREGVWERARAEVEATLDRAPEQDLVALWTFDHRLRAVLSVDEARGLGPEGSRAELLRRLSDLAPGWGGTELGGALLEVASGLDRLEGLERPRVELVTDLQRGSRLDALDDAAWPETVALHLHPVRASGSNASLEGAPARGEDSGDEPALWVRVRNAADSGLEQFELRWTDAEGRAIEGVHPAVFVPPGESRVVRAPPRPRPDCDHLRLVGDEESFDNDWFDQPPSKARLRVLVAGDEGPEPGPLHYLERALGEHRNATVAVQRGDPSEASGDPSVPLMVFAMGGPDPAVDPAILSALTDHAASGGVVLLLLLETTGDTGPPRDAIEFLLGHRPQELEEVADRDALLETLDFGHPLFEPFADPRYRDFRKIRFWRHRRLRFDEPGPRVLAAFDDGSPFLLEAPVGRGQVMVCTAGWHPADSNFARATKFPPWLLGILGRASVLRPAPTGLVVGEPLEVGRWTEGAPAELIDPAGRRHRLDAGTASFPGTDLPGVYRIESGRGSQSLAVNLDGREGDSDPLEPIELERRGVVLGEPEPDGGIGSVAQQQQDRELEAGQKLWRWVVILTLVLLSFETFWAGRTTRSSQMARSE